MLPRSQFRKYSPQETLSTLTFKKHSFKVRCWLFHQIAREKASTCFLVRHSRDISYTYPCETCIYMHPCETSKRHMYPCETLERHMCPCEILERKMHPSLWDMYLHASLWDIRETDASILGRGCIQHQVLCAIPFNINMIQVCKKWRREKLKSEQSIHSSPMMNFNFESESEQALTMRKNVTIGVNWPFIRLLRIILPDWKWIELM